MSAFEFRAYLAGAVTLAVLVVATVALLAGQSGPMRSACGCKSDSALFACEMRDPRFLI